MKKMRIGKAFAADGLAPIKASNAENAHFLRLQTGENIPNNTLGRGRSGGKQRKPLQRKGSICVVIVNILFWREFVS